VMERPDADSFSILVNSSDGFEDCWPPFFALFTRYWPNCQVPILLNTELKGWSYSHLNIKCTQVQHVTGSVKRLSWSECLEAALSQVTTPLVLYLQEDYFFKAPVEVSLISSLCEKMVADINIRHIGLTNFGSCGPFLPTDDPHLWEISQFAPYRISAQAAIWRVDTLRSYLRPWENAWMFEIFGTRRAMRRPELFLTLTRDPHHSERVSAIDYIQTGIIKGKWHPEIPNLFRQHGIEVDFRKRGFYEPKPPLIRRLDLLRRLVVHPINAVRSLWV